MFTFLTNSMLHLLQQKYCDVTHMRLLLNTSFITKYSFKILSELFKTNCKIIVQPECFHTQWNGTQGNKKSYKTHFIKTDWFWRELLSREWNTWRQLPNMIRQMECRINIHIHATTWQSLLPEMKALNATKQYITKHFPGYDWALCLFVSIKAGKSLPEREQNK